MTPELTALTLAALLQIAQVMLAGVCVGRSIGMGWLASPRDRAPSREPSVIAARLKRAADNHFEGLLLFTIAVAVVTASGAASSFTAACAWIYLAARILYVPAYAFGWSPGRPIIWGVGLFATLAMLLAALF